MFCLFTIHYLPVTLRASCRRDNVFAVTCSSRLSAWLPFTCLWTCRHECHKSQTWNLYSENSSAARHQWCPGKADVRCCMTCLMTCFMTYHHVFSLSLSPLNLSAEILSANNKVAPTTSNFVFIVRGRNLNLAHAQSSPTHEQQILCDGRLEVVSKRDRDRNYKRMSMTLDSNFCTWWSNRLVHGRIDLVKVVNS